MLRETLGKQTSFYSMLYEKIPEPIFIGRQDMFTKQNGNKSFLFLSILFICIFVLTSCPSLSDWEYDLPNNYQIVRVNSECIVFGKIDGTFDRTIDRHIISFCYNERYVGLKRISMDGLPNNESVDTKNMDCSDIEFYLIDTELDIEYGPFGEKDYVNQINDLHIDTMCNWISSID